MKIGDRTVGDDAPVFIIAEAGVNHNGDLETARRLIDAAVAAGADAVKFQSFSAEDLATPSAGKARYQAETTPGAESQQEMLRRLEIPEEGYLRLAGHARKRGILFLCTPFSTGDADMLGRIGVPAMKIPSGEITNLPFLRHVAGMGLPVILSTGMATLGEIERAVQEIRGGGQGQLALLHCITSYPARLEEMNLRVIRTLRQAFGFPVGFSDHTLGIVAPPVAVACGACIIEKHLTLDRTMPGPDHRSSVEPGEFAEMVRTIRAVEQGLGNGIRTLTAGEQEIRRVARRSVVAAEGIPAGSEITRGMLTVKRPGTGIPPGEMESLIGRRARIRIPRDSLIGWDMVE
jgi:N-acetylneuraminate synthase/N,N'-diacetyllegionaminate synthase